MVLLENADCLFVTFIVVRYSFLCYAIPSRLGTDIMISEETKTA